ncbi:hypothetical protein FKG96_09865 [Olivibacter sp. LS-1]|uniref:hypothetical protein n=1 Tax=Olivibacter sp. LS-1 TaxID=2592345 RepID=UPI0011EB4B82|nr:hypothetical protein [Olivibacter sp. LS-1]QEL01099.1 hypothetical protein FKG96_09865 [Olivibacter sp. LS-1]
MNKIENTPENKARFFGLYYMQPVLSGSDMWNTVNGYCLNIIRAQNYHLELTHISQITDDDAIELAQILTRWVWNLDLGTKVIKESNQITVYYDALNNGFKHRTTIYDDFFSRNYTGDPIQPFTGESFDYLRSKGYALTWMGLSVEDLINYGWIKLREASHG